jgi:hypothetical protein
MDRAQTVHLDPGFVSRMARELENRNYITRIIDGLRVVSDLQLYLDLHGCPIRGLEQAEYLLDSKLKPLFAKVNTIE